MPAPSELSTAAPSVDTSAPAYDVTTFFVLACAITWTTNLPWVLACLRGVAAPPYALPLLGLGAWGPTLAAVVVAARRGSAREVFARWRTHPAWVVVALGVSPFLLHLPATLLEVALGGRPAQWFYPPDQPELIAGLVMFSLGEEFGWRGFAYPRLVQSHGPLVGSAVLGVVWGLWHFGMMFTAEEGAPEVWELPYVCLTLALSSIVWAWFLERGNRSLAVAIALHAGAHLDKVSRAPEHEVRLRVLRFLVLVIVAGLAAYSLTRNVNRAVRASSRAPT
jgi:uncharacterized protein